MRGEIMAIRSLEEIEQQIKVLQAEAEELRLAEGIDQLRSVIRKYKVGISQFKIALGADKKRKHGSTKRSPTHRNPNNPDQTWTGRGRKPRWLVAALDAGNTDDQCRIRVSTLPDIMQTHHPL
jgi:DNA-binding protein H-NS